VQEPFVEKAPETLLPHCGAVRRLIEKFRETGPVLEAERRGKPSEPTDEKLLDISDYAVESIKIVVQASTTGRYWGLQQCIKWPKNN
jgi:hypothetical protein